MAAGATPNARRIPSVPPHWQNFGICLLFHLVLPLIPLSLDLWIRGHVGLEALTLSTAMYAISIGASSKSQLQFGFGIVVGLIFAVSYGAIISESISFHEHRKSDLDNHSHALAKLAVVSDLRQLHAELKGEMTSFTALVGALDKSPKGLPRVDVLCWICLICIFVVHAAERYNRHVVDRGPFWEFY